MLHPVEARWKFEHPDRLQLFSLPTPNGVKANTALEELGLPYEAHRIDIGAGDQHTPEYRTLSPNGKIPALLDPAGPDGKPLAIMESAAILIYLADKAERLIPQDARGRSECLQWLFFQVGHVGPMFGQFGHFHKFARDKSPDPYPFERYRDESKRLLGVLDERLSTREFILGDEYSIADIALWPWLWATSGFYEATDILEMKSFAHAWEWFERCLARPASQRGLEVTSKPE